MRTIFRDFLRAILGPTTRNDNKTSRKLGSPSQWRKTRTKAEAAARKGQA